MVGMPEAAVPNPDLDKQLEERKLHFTSHNSFIVYISPSKNELKTNTSK